MQRLIIIFAAVSVLTTPSFAAAKRRTAVRHAVTRPAAPHTPVAHTPAATKAKAPVRPATKAASAYTARRRTYTPVRRTYTPYQTQPAPERVKQIQQALADKGYYKGEITGQWDANSVSALKSFQTEQKLTSDGKLNSLSLIALGLGPKRTLSAESQPSPVTQPTAPIQVQNLP